MKYFFFFLFFSLFAVSEKVEYIELGSEIQDPVKIKSFEKVKPKNIILLIGDGTGFNQIALSRMAIAGYDSRLYLDKLPFTGISLTHSADNIVTDSAAAATAWSTGHKTNNKFLSIKPNKEVLQTLPEKLYRKGFLSGLVATSSITHATPAAFYAHVDNRYKEKEIARQLQGSSINIALGGGKKFFDIDQENINYLYNLNDLPKDGPGSSKRVIGLFANDGIRRSEASPTQLAMTSAAIEHLLSRTSNCSGFFLMSEGSQIDWAGHDNDAKKMIEEFRDFDATIKEVIKFINKNKNTLLIVTADHETGGLQILKKSKNLIKVQWGTGSHTAGPVGVFSYGPGAENFEGTMDNTDIHNKILNLLSFSDLEDSSCKY
jgi:alkaline phosphatase